MTDYSIGDVLQYSELDGLPVGTLLVCPEEGGHNVIARRENHWAWWVTTANRVDTSHGPRIYAGTWTIVHLPASPAPMVGDIVDTKAQAAALPVGSVMLEDPRSADCESEGQRPAVKIAPGTWMYCGLDDEPKTDDDALPIDLPHRVLYVPDADAVTGRTAA